MGVNIPQPFKSSVSGGISVVGPVQAQVSGIPNTFHFNVDNLPKVQIGVDPVRLSLDPLDVSLRLERIPDVRAHMPADFTVGLSLLGLNVLALRLCGEAQVITEPYYPNPCEHCGRPSRQALPKPGAVPA